jgi:hypothetical protein
MFSGLVPTSQPVPNWAVASAVGAPVALVTSTSLATLLPTTPYDPFGQTMSVLAATPRSAPVMTIGFVLTAMGQIATAAGLHVVPHALGGMRLGRPRRLGPVGAGETQRGVDLGLAERTTVMGDTVWPLGVSATARSSSGEFPGQTENGYSAEGVPRPGAHQPLRLPHVAGPGPLPIPVPTRSPGEIVELPNQAGDRRISADLPRGDGIASNAHRLPSGLDQRPHRRSAQLRPHQ